MQTFCTCRGGDSPECGTCQAFAAWESSLTDAERGSMALDFLAQLNKATGQVTGNVGSPSLGYFATVEFDGVGEFEKYLLDVWAAQDARKAA